MQCERETIDRTVDHAATGGLEPLSGRGQRTGRDTGASPGPIAGGSPPAAGAQRGPAAAIRTPDAAAGSPRRNHDKPVRQQRVYE